MMNFRQPMALLNARRILVRVYHQLQLLQSPVPCNHGNYSHLAVTSGWLQASVDRHLPERRLFHSGVVLCSMKKSIKGFIPDSNAINKLQDVHVTGLDGEDLGTMTKRKARELAENLEVKLVLTEKEPSGRIKYKLMTGKQVTEERLRLQQLKKAEKKKAVKNTRITSKISKHDLQMKTKQLLQWVDKGHEVKITVKSATPNSSQAAVEVFKYISENAKEIAVIKQAKKTDIEMVYTLTPIQAERNTDQMKPLTNEELKALKETDDKV